MSKNKTAPSNETTGVGTSAGGNRSPSNRPALIQAGGIYIIRDDDDLRYWKNLREKGNDKT